MDAMTVRMKNGSLFLFTDPGTGLLYGFCSKACKDAWAVAETEHSPDVVNEKWGCHWCGTSMNPDYDQITRRTHRER